MSNITLLNIDCMEYMKDIPDKYFDLAVVDPPYGIGFDKENKSMSGGIRKDGSIRKMKEWNNPKPKNYKSKNWDDNIPSENYFIEINRISKNQIIWGANYFTEYLLPHGGWIVWDKGVPDGMSLSQAELAYNTNLNSIKIVKILWAGYKKANNENRIHPTQKPVKLYDWIYKNYLPEGGKVIDTHLGSGSNAIAADKAGNIEFVGCELDKDYYETMLKRFNNYKQQMKLF